MQKRLTPESEDAEGEERAPFGQRLLRNQRGIMIAVALTLAAAGVILMRLKG